MSEAKTVPVEPSILERHARIGALLAQAGLDANHPAMIDWAAVGFELRRAAAPAAGELERLAVDDLHLYGQGESYTFDELAELCRKDDEAREMRKLAVEIADEAAWGVIFCESKWRSLDGENWYDTGFAERDGDSVDAEVKCLELRGLLEHHPDHPELVRVKETPTQREGESDGR